MTPHDFSGMTALYVGIALAALASLGGYMVVGAHPALLLPVAIAATPLMARNAAEARRLRVVAVAALAILAFVAGFSIGLFYVPAIVAMVVSADQVNRSQ